MFFLFDLRLSVFLIGSTCGLGSVSSLGLPRLHAGVRRKRGIMIMIMMGNSMGAHINDQCIMWHVYGSLESTITLISFLYTRGQESKVKANYSKVKREGRSDLLEIKFLLSFSQNRFATPVSLFLKPTSYINDSEYPKWNDSQQSPNTLQVRRDAQNQSRSAHLLPSIERQYPACPGRSKLKFRDWLLTRNQWSIRISCP